MTISQPEIPRVSVEAMVALRELGSSLRRAREAKRLTIASVAQTTGVDPADLERLEAGDPRVATGVLVAALHAVGMASRLRGLVPEVELTPKPNPDDFRF